MTSSSWLTPYRPYRWLPATPGWLLRAVEIQHGNSQCQRCSITTWLVHHGPGISQIFFAICKAANRIQRFSRFQSDLLFFATSRKFVLVTRGYHWKLRKGHEGTHHARHLRLPALCTESREALCPLLWWSPVLKHMQYIAVSRRCPEHRRK